MKASRTLLLVSVLLTWLAWPSFADKGVPLGVSFVSPDGQYSVQLQELVMIPHFVIKNMGTEEVDSSLVMPTLLFYLHWAANSKSFVTVEHTAKGSYGRVVYLAGDKWKDLKVVPPFEGRMDAAVIKLQLGMDSVHYKFAVRTLARDWTPIDYWFCDLDVNLGAGKVSNVKWTPTSQAAWAATLWPRKPLYLPPMER
jgi:hypothetical protein